MSSAMMAPAFAARVVSPARRDARAIRSRAGGRATFSVKPNKGNNEIVARAFSIVEPATKVSFPKTFNVHGGDTMQCIGAGVREKKIAIINVKVYGVAMYVDPAGCKEEMANGGSLLTGSFDKALLVQLVRNVDGKTFWEALDEAVGPRIRRIATDMATAEDEDGNFMATVAEAAEVAEEKAMDECDSIKGLFQGRKLRKDDKVLIWWSPKGQVRDWRRGRHAAGAHVPAARAGRLRRVLRRRPDLPGRVPVLRRRRRGAVRGFPSFITVKHAIYYSSCRMYFCTLSLIDRVGCNSIYSSAIAGRARRRTRDVRSLLGRLHHRFLAHLTADVLLGSQQRVPRFVHPRPFVAAFSEPIRAHRARARLGRPLDLFRLTSSIPRHLPRAPRCASPLSRRPRR